jgi:hypothetical protein
VLARSDTEQCFARYSAVEYLSLELEELLVVALRYGTSIRADCRAEFHADFALCSRGRAQADDRQVPPSAVHYRVQHCGVFYNKS